MTKSARQFWQGKIVLVTGGSAGFGWFIASAFAKRGAKVFVNGRDETRLNEAVDRIVEEGGDATALPGDVTNANDVTSMFATMIDNAGQLDVLINNAGRSDRGAAMETSVEQFRELLELNFLSLVRCTQTALPNLLKTGGHIVNIGSLGAKTVSPFLGAYPTSKFPVTAYSHQLRLELAPQGIHTLLVCPGPIAVPKASDRYEKLAAEKQLPASAGQPGGGVRLKGIDPVWLADRIVRACEQRTPELIVPRRARWLFAVSTL